jgi:site-specific DNA-methyltransferase (adenine-specific)
VSESFLNGRVTLHRGDCLEVLPTLEECSIDSCVTDPPYHLTSMVRRLSKTDSGDVEKNFTKTIPGQTTNPFQSAARGFMGKQWDGGDIAFRPELWAEVYRVLKPGAHLLAFSGTRTYHRMACAIEDAGFEIRDQIQWIYGSGFAKSRDPWRLEMKEKVETALREQGVTGEIVWK